MDLERVFEPLQVGPMRVKNRVCETTNTIGAGRLAIAPDDPFIEHHLAKARGGIGWIGNETWVLDCPLPDHVPDEIIPGGAAQRIPAYYLPDVQEGVQRFTDLLHDEGAVAVFQLTELNAMYGPSTAPVSGGYDWVPHACTEDEIEYFIEAYANAALAFHESGVDGVEIHASHETLPHLFLSPATNLRTDAWGGDPVRRVRFINEIINRIREHAGDSLAIGVRFGAEESRLHGYDLDEAEELVGLIEGGSGPDFFNIDLGHSWGDPPYVPSSFYEPGLGASRAKRLRGALEHAAVLYAGKVLDLEQAEGLLEEGACDLVGMTRASIADPEFVNKAREGRSAEIRGCIGVNTCIDNAVQGTGTGLFQIGQRAMCAVNSKVGNEMYWGANFAQPRQARRVVVVGAGPAGCEAARVAAERGHDVTLLERRSTLGGQVALAGRVPGREQFKSFVTYQEVALTKAGVKVRLSTDATPEAVTDLSPDALVVATGSLPLTPRIAGADGDGVHQGRDVIEETVTVAGERVVVLAQEDGMETVCVALVLAEQGKQVEVFHHWSGVASAVGRYSLPPVLKRFERLGVRTTPYVRAAEIDGGKVALVSSVTGEPHATERYDAVVLSCGSSPDTRLYDQLNERIEGPSFLVGSAWAPRGIAEATEQGMKIGLEL